MNVLVPFYEAHFFEDALYYCWDGLFNLIYQLRVPIISLVPLQLTFAVVFWVITAGTRRKVRTARKTCRCIRRPVLDVFKIIVRIVHVVEVADGPAVRGLSLLYLLLFSWIHWIGARRLRRQMTAQIKHASIRALGLAVAIFTARFAYHLRVKDNSKECLESTWLLLNIQRLS